MEIPLMRMMLLSAVAGASVSVPVSLVVSRSQSVAVGSTTTSLSTPDTSTSSTIEVREVEELELGFTSLDPSGETFVRPSNTVDFAEPNVGISQTVAFTFKFRIPARYVGDIRTDCPAWAPIPIKANFYGFDGSGKRLPNGGWPRSFFPQTPDATGHALMTEELEGNTTWVSQWTLVIVQLCTVERGVPVNFESQ